MNQFCEMKGIMRQFSVARTPQQNKVAEKRNIIEAVRTMLAASKFSENTPNVVGSGPDWLFDIDALTRTMSYEPIVAGTQSNDLAGTKASDNVGQVRKETEHVKDYILLPLWTVDIPFSQDLKSSQDDGFKPSSDDGKKVDEDSRNESECKDQQKEDNVNNTDNVNTMLAHANEDEDDDAVAGMNNLDTTIHPFLNEKIEEEVYVCQPPGFKDPDFPDKVYKVKKALYGLHQAPRAWYETLSTYLLDNGFQKGKIDKTLFIKRHKGNILLVQVYVVDIIFSSTRKELCNTFERLMHEKCQMSFMGELTFFLGLKVKKKNDGIFISKDKCVVEILKDEDGEEVDVHMYRSIIGSLMYQTSSRHDIMSAVCACARYQVNLMVSHLHAMKSIFRYLKGRPKLGLWYPKDSPFDLIAYTDSDYARASLDRLSTTGGCQYLMCRLISW
nr:hypothetical protein [Tanacetum cinerariifolium]